MRTAFARRGVTSADLNAALPLPRPRDSGVHVLAASGGYTHKRHESDGGNRLFLCVLLFVALSGVLLGGTAVYIALGAGRTAESGAQGKGKAGATKVDLALPVASEADAIEALIGDWSAEANATLATIESATADLAVRAPVPRRSKKTRKGARKGASPLPPPVQQPPERIGWWARLTRWFGGSSADAHGVGEVKRDGSLAARLAHARVKHFTDAVTRACGAGGGRNALWHEARHRRAARAELADGSHFALWRVVPGEERQTLLQSVSCGARVRLIGMHHAVLLAHFTAPERGQSASAGRARRQGGDLIWAQAEDAGKARTSTPTNRGWLHVASESAFESVFRLLNEGDVAFALPPTSCIDAKHANAYVAAAVQRGREHHNASLPLSSPVRRRKARLSPPAAAAPPPAGEESRGMHPGLAAERRAGKGEEERSPVAAEPEPTPTPHSTEAMIPDGVMDPSLFETYGDVDGGDSNSDITKQRRLLSSDDVRSSTEAVALPSHALSRTRDAAALRKFFGLTAVDETYDLSLGGFDQARGVRLIAVHKKKTRPATLANETHLLVLGAPSGDGSVDNAVRILSDWSVRVERFTRGVVCPGAPQGRCVILVRAGPLTPALMALAAAKAPEHSYIDATIFSGDEAVTFRGIRGDRKRLRLWSPELNMTGAEVLDGEQWKDACDGVTAAAPAAAPSSLMPSSHLADTALESHVPCLGISALAKPVAESNDEDDAARIVPRDADGQNLVLGMLRCRKAFTYTQIGTFKDETEKKTVRAHSEIATKAVASLEIAAAARPLVPQFAGLPLPPSPCRGARVPPPSGFSLSQSARMAVGSKALSLMPARPMRALRAELEHVLAARLAESTESVLVLASDSPVDAGRMPERLGSVRRPGRNCTKRLDEGDRPPVAGPCAKDELVRWAVEQLRLPGVKATGFVAVSMGSLTSLVVAELAASAQAPQLTVMDVRGMWDDDYDSAAKSTTFCSQPGSWRVHTSGCVQRFAGAPCEARM